MSAIRIRKTIDSDILHLPELRPFIGHTVEIVIEDRASAASATSGIIAGTGDWDSVLKAAQQLRDYDYNAQGDQDAVDAHDAQDRLR
jgi:hypothetical protein